MNAMKLRLKDKVMVIRGRDKGKKGEVVAVLPKENKVVVEGINIAKKHTKPSAKTPRGGIVELAKPIDVAKVMILDPTAGKPARIGYKLDAKGNKERIFKVSKFQNKTKSKASEKPAKAAKPEKNEK